jgi:hypothetical protein
MPDAVTRTPDAPPASDEPPAAPLLRDPPPPPGYVNPVEQSEILEQPPFVRDEA